MLESRSVCDGTDISIHIYVHITALGVYTFNSSNYVSSDLGSVELDSCITYTEDEIESVSILWTIGSAERERKHGI